MSKRIRKNEMRIKSCSKNMIMLNFLFSISLTIICSLSGCAHIHKWEEAECVTPKTCKICGKTKGEPSGHDWKEATCTEPQTCSRCGKTKGDSIGHDWKEATCIDAKTCSRCGVTEGDPLEHDWKEATCTEAKNCVRCNAIEGEPLDHNWEEATCTEAKRCSRCNITLGDALEHEVPGLSCTESAMCTRCGEEVLALGHDWKEATCTEPKTCKRCSETEGRALGHNLSDTVIENEIEPNCTEGGQYDEAVYCTRCNEEISRKTKTVKALGHKSSEFIVENETKATCTEKGSYDEVIYCSVCNEEISRKTKVEKAHGHTSSEPVEENEVKATCVEKGTYDEVVYCSVCNIEISRKSKTKPALGHRTSAPVKENVKKVSCTENGGYDEVVYCSRCHNEISRKTNVEKALGHTTTNGKCTRCNVEIYETVNGKGDDVHTDISVGDGMYKVHFKHSGKSYFSVWVHDSAEDSDLAVSDIGNYDGYFLLTGPSPYTFEITSRGKWSYTIESIGVTSEKSFNGHGCYVTDAFSASSGKWHITHKGKGYFSVWLYTTDGADLVANGIGEYDGNRLLSIPARSNAVLVIHADGDWTITPAD